MNILVKAAINRARMVVAFIVLSVAAGWLAFTGLPKEGSPNIDIPTLYVSVTYPGVSATDAERLLVKPLENQLKSLDGLKEMTGVATEGHASVALEFEFGFDKEAIVAEVRAEVDEAQAEFPADALEPRIIEINTSEFPILNITLSGSAPERTLLRAAQNLQDVIEGIGPVLEAEMNGQRDELLEIIIRPSRLETYNITAAELLQVVRNNNQVVAAGQVTSDQGAFSVKVPGSVETISDLSSLPIKVSGERTVTLADLAEVRRTFEDRETIARFNGEPTISLSVKKRPGVNIIDTVAQVREATDAFVDAWPDGLKESVKVSYSLDESTRVQDMVEQLQSSVITAICLVMIVVVAALGLRSAALVGFAIPTSFLLAFALMASLGMSVNNMVMFGLILAVGMLVDGAIVVTEYADMRTAEGARPSEAYGEAADRMFWPIVSSTATTLCAFLPMLFWPGMPGQFMRYLPITLIFVLTASLLVALIYMPITGVIIARATRFIGNISVTIRKVLGWAGAMALGGIALFGIAALIKPTLVSGEALAPTAIYPIVALAVLAVFAFAAAFQRKTRAVKPYKEPKRRLGVYGFVLKWLTNNPIAPVLVILLTGAMLFTIFTKYGERSLGVEFFVDQDPEIANLYVSARGNLSIEEKDAIMKVVEEKVLSIDDIDSALTIVGSGGGGANSQSKPKDMIGSIQFEFENWRKRKFGKEIMDEITAATAQFPGVRFELAEQSNGPEQGKPINIQLAANNDSLIPATKLVQEKLLGEPGLKDVSSTLPLPGIEWELEIDRTEAGKYGANVASIGAMVQMVTRGVPVGTWRPDDSEEEIDIRGRFPTAFRTIETLDSLRVQTNVGLVPLSNFVERKAVAKVSEITRIDGVRVFTVSADVEPGTNPTEKIAELGEWLKTADLGKGVVPSFAGDFEEQQESQAFLMKAFMGALGLMFIILLAQFDSFYNSVLVLLAVVLSVGGVLVGMMVMGQPFSIIMTGIGIVALAGIVVNNNIVLIDTFQSLRKDMPPLEAIVETGRQRLRPVLLTTITTIAGLLPMMFAVSIDFVNGGITVGAPSALWWTQLATAIVFGLGFATLLTLFVTPSLLALRVWYWGKLPAFGWRGLKAAVLKTTVGSNARYLKDRRVKRTAKRLDRDVIWSEMPSFMTPAVASAGASAGAGITTEALTADTETDTTLRQDPGYIDSLMASVRVKGAPGSDMSELLEADHEPFPRDPDAPTPRNRPYPQAAE